MYSCYLMIGTPNESIDMILFTERCAAQGRFERTESLYPARYGFTLGDYATAPVLTTTKENGHSPSTESFITAHVERLLDTRPDRPVVAHDIGGVGLSWLRMAERFKEAITEGRLGLVVSHLEATPEGYLAAITPNDSETQQQLDEVRRLYGLYGTHVHYLQDRFRDYSDPAIVLQGGQQVKLKGNTDVLHDRRALTAWSKIPERQVVHAGRRLSDEGVYMTHKIEVKSIVLGAESHEEVVARRKGKAAGLLALREVHALQQVESVEAGSHKGDDLAYYIIKGAAAPLIVI